MSEKTIIMDTGAGETPAIENNAAIYSYAPNLYINNSPDDELRQLRENQLIRDFASVNPEIYSLVASTNPTLKLFFDLAKKICEVEG